MQPASSSVDDAADLLCSLKETQVSASIASSAESVFAPNQITSPISNSSSLANSKPSNLAGTRRQREEDETSVGDNKQIHQQNKHAHHHHPHHHQKPNDEVSPFSAVHPVAATKLPPVSPISPLTSIATTTATAPISTAAQFLAATSPSISLSKKMPTLVRANTAAPSLSTSANTAVATTTPAVAQLQRSLPQQQQQLASNALLRSATTGSILASSSISPAASLSRTNTPPTILQSAASLSFPRAGSGNSVTPIAVAAATTTVVLSNGKIVRTPTAVPLSRTGSASSLFQQQQASAQQQISPLELRNRLLQRFEMELKNVWDAPTASATATNATATTTVMTSRTVSIVAATTSDSTPSLTLHALCHGTVDAILGKYNNNAKESSECATQLLGLLRDETNGPPLRNRLRCGSLTVAQLVSSKLEDLLSDEQKAKQEEELAAHLLSRDQNYLLKLRATPSPFFKCRNCGSRECVMEQKQTSRGDEGTTCFIFCTECKRSWKTRQ